MTVSHAAHQPLKVRRRFVALVGPYPEIAVAIPAALVFGGIVSGGVGQVQVVIDHLDESLAVGLFVRRPEIVGVIVGRDIDPLGAGLRRRR